jgi:tricarboxylate carrier
METYSGRVLHFLSIIDPRLLLVNNTKLTEARELIAGYHVHADKPSAGDLNEKLWEAKRIIDASVNHSTGEVIHPAARMCAFIPASLPITLGMLTMTSTKSVMIWQWINQSYNALFNYSHRSKPGNDKSQVLKAYGLATATSCGLALGLSKIATKIRPPWLISTFAVMAAGSANVAFTRANEFTEGVDVFDKEGNIVGKSRTAGKYAVGYTILSRSVFLPVPLMVLPGALSSIVRTHIFKSGVSKRQKLVLDIGCIILSQVLALPLCIAAFPQKLELKRSLLEPEFKASEGEGGFLYVQKGV